MQYLVRIYQNVEVQEYMEKYIQFIQQDDKKRNTNQPKDKKKLFSSLVNRNRSRKTILILVPIILLVFIALQFLFSKINVFDNNLMPNSPEHFLSDNVDDSQDKNTFDKKYSGNNIYGNLEFKVEQLSDTDYEITIYNGGENDYSIGWVGYKTLLKTSHETRTYSGYMNKKVYAGNTISYTAKFENVSGNPEVITICNIIKLNNSGLPTGSSQDGAKINVNLNK